MSQRREPSATHNEPDNRKPSEVMDDCWIFADRKKGEYPARTPNSGKWLIFVPLAQLDVVWEKIKRATEEGKLGSSAKTGTGRLNPNAKDPFARVICVFTYDWSDSQDVMRIRQELRELGITQRIPYKADEETHSGKYAVRGDQRISKYYV